MFKSLNYDLFKFQYFAFKKSKYRFLVPEPSHLKVHNENFNICFGVYPFRQIFVCGLITIYNVL